MVLNNIKKHNPYIYKVIKKTFTGKYICPKCDYESIELYGEIEE